MSTFEHLDIEWDRINSIGEVEVVMLKGEKGDPTAPTDEQAQEAINNWLDEHPEATTTVQDGSITKQKLATALQEQIDGNTSAINEISQELSGVDALLGSGVIEE